MHSNPLLTSGLAPLLNSEEHYPQGRSTALAAHRQGEASTMDGSSTTGSSEASIFPGGGGRMQFGPGSAEGPKLRRQNAHQALKRSKGIFQDTRAPRVPPPAYVADQKGGSSIGLPVKPSEQADNVSVSTGNSRIDRILQQEILSTRGAGSIRSR